MSAAGVISTVLLAVGVSLELLTVLGVSVMRDAYDRLHYVTAACLGGLLIGVAVLVSQSFSLIGDKALVTGAVLAGTGPVTAHFTARSLRVRERGEWSAGATEEDPG